MSKLPRRDETQHLICLKPTDPQPRTDAEVVRNIAHMVREALQARATMIQVGSEGVEYDLGLMRERLAKEGVKADLRAIRVGQFFAVFTEFNLLQRINRAIESQIDGSPNRDTLSPDEES